MLLLIAAIGVSLYEEWGRKLVLRILYLIGIGFAAMGFFLAKNVYAPEDTLYERVQVFLPFILLIFAYVVLVGLILFVNSSKMKEEFKK